MIDTAVRILQSTFAGGTGVISTIELRPALTDPPEHIEVNTPGVVDTRLGGGRIRAVSNSSHSTGTQQ
ncbi:hypothetical protein [Halorubrum sp. AJ67]|uniref:hypothetical protein n=1 Tax=Halorubrum sp. AJ67 TaxID=1173487 RepID=UPI00064F2733|nr:hypothetical protein [Halorubrum sp. AJ67]